MQTCPFCLKDDLHVEAKRCPYCRSWLDEREDIPARFEDFRKEIRTDLRADLSGHRDFLEKLFSRVQLAAAITLGLALILLVLLGFKTGDSMKEITEKVKS